MENIEARYDAYFEQENRVNRRVMLGIIYLFIDWNNCTDTRVHALLYFIAPNGHGLRHIDIEFMKQLHEKVNLIPLIAKADTMTAPDLAAFKVFIYLYLRLLFDGGEYFGVFGTTQNSVL